MSHVRTLNLLNNRAILPQAPEQRSEVQTGDDQFSRLFKDLRAEATGASRRTETSRQSSARRGEDSATRVEADQAEQPQDERVDDRAPGDATDNVDDRHAEDPGARAAHDDGQTDRQHDRSTPEEPNATDPNAPPSSETSPAGEQPASAESGQGQQTPASETSNAGQSAVATSSVEPVVGAATDAASTQTPVQAQGAAVETATGTDRSTATMLTQPGQDGTSPTPASQTSVPAQTNTPTDAPTTGQTSQAGVSVTGQSTSPVPSANAEGTEATPKTQPAGEPQPSSADPLPVRASQTEVDGPRILQADVREPVEGGRSRPPTPQPTQHGPQTDRPQPQPQTAPNPTPTGEHERSNVRVPSSAASTAEPTPTPAEVKAAASEGADEASTEQSRTKQAASGYVTRMSTQPVGQGATGSGPSNVRSDQQNQALAVEATRQIARFIVANQSEGESTKAKADSRGSVPSSSASSGPTDSGASTPSSSPTEPTLWSAITAPLAGDDRAGDGSGLTRVSATETTTDTAAQDSVDRVVRVLRAHVGARDSQVRIQLDPPELGRVRVDIRMRNDTLFLHVETETTAGRDLLNSRLGQLREALQQQGILVERANVQMRDAVQDTPQTREHQQQPSSQSNQQHGQDAPGQMTSQSGNPDHRDGPARGQDVPAPSGPAGDEADASLPDDDQRQGGGGLSASVTESRVDLVA